MSEVEDRVARERFARIVEAMAEEGADLLLLSKSPAAQWASGARRVQVLGSGGGVPWVVIARGLPAPLVYTTDPDGLPRWLGDGGRLMWWNPAKLAADIRALVPSPGTRPLRVAVDAVSVAFVRLLEAVLGGVDWLDAEPIVARAREATRGDDDALADRARAVAEASLGAVAAELRPGASGAKLAAAHMRSAIELGATFLAMEPVIRRSSLDGGAVLRPSDVVRAGDRLAMEIAVVRDGAVGEARASWVVTEERCQAPFSTETVPGTFFATDLTALARARRAKVDRALEREAIDALVLLKASNVRYATGAAARFREASREARTPLAALLSRGRTHLLLLPETGDECAVPAAEREVASFFVDDLPGAARFADLVAEALPGARRIAIDRWSAPLRAALRRRFSAAEWIDADSVLGPERMVKLPAEVDLLRRAQELNEAAIGAVIEAMRPGVREIDLTAAFHGRLGELGVTAVVVESVWCAVPKTRRDAPWSPPSALPYRELTSDRRLAAGDLVVMDTGIAHEGYLSDFGRTWRCGGAPDDRERRLFSRWAEIRERLFAACRPGNTALDLRRAALAGWKRPEPPWPLPLYVAHSLGLGGVEPPFVGTDLGEAVEERCTLRPGMVLVFEPYFWEEGVGGYRAEESAVVTERGCERLTRFGYGGFDA